MSIASETRSRLDPFVLALARIQEREKLLDTEFGARIGVSGAAIWRYKEGDRRPSSDVIRRCVRQWPELLGYLMIAPE